MGKEHVADVSPYVGAAPGVIAPTRGKRSARHSRQSAGALAVKSVYIGEVYLMYPHQQVHIWTRPRCQGAREWNNTLRDRCSHISGLWVKTFHSLRALMKSALPRLITTTASRALSLRRLGGSRSDRSWHQLVHTSHGAEGLLELSVKSKSC